ncbi:MAG: GerMN domain-containing protein [Bacillota bacterium]|nr:GerMN domain-containing protein [Clostridia bacterium]
MKKVRFILISLLMLLIAFTGCAVKSPQEEDAKKAEVEKVKLYYGDANNEKMIPEEREISFAPGEDKYRIILQELIKGPENENLRSNISENTKVYGTILQDSDIIINFSSAFNQFGGSVAEIIAVGSVVNTMTGLDEIERVKILVEGEELVGPSGEPRGFMTAFPLDPGKQTETADVVLYFSNKNADKLGGETREVAATPEEDREDFIKKVLEELIRGPKKDDLYPAIPKEVVVISVKINQGTAEIDFSEEMHTRHWGGAAGETMTIYSIVNTLTEFDFIQRVKITVNKNPLAIEHTILEDPVERSESIIQS